ncbi:hypothetical protein EV182_003909, partial [Spiromyces aspiralis]
AHDPDRVAVLRSLRALPTKRLVEVWKCGTLDVCIDVTEAHGDFYGDATFGNLNWSPNGRYLAYTAEFPERAGAKRNVVKHGSNADTTSKSEEGSSRRGDPASKGYAGVADPRKYEIEEDWGESYNGKRPPAIVVVDLEKQEAYTLFDKFAEAKVSPGQVRLVGGEGSERLVFTGYSYKTRKYGIIACQNRPAKIYQCDLGGNDWKDLTPEYHSVRSPRVSPCGRYMAFIVSNLGGAHAGTSRLGVYDFETERSWIVVPEVQVPNSKITAASKDGEVDLPPGFPGLHAGQLPNKCWVRLDSDNASGIGEYVLLANSLWRSRMTVLAIDFAAKKLPNATPRLALGKLVRSRDGDNGLVVAGGRYADLSLPGLDSEGVKIVSRNVEWEVMDFPMVASDVNAIIIRPSKKVLEEGGSHFTHYFIKEGQGSPLVIYPHGGPHMTYHTDYYKEPIALAVMGFTVALINYTGSLGFGQKSITDLVGNIGTLEVAQVQNIAAHLIENAHSLGIDPERTIFNGGSHSGLIGAHVAGLFPNFYKAIILRNPVINVGENLVNSDVPDWSWAEAGMEFDFTKPRLLTPEAYQRLWKVSPQKYVDKVVDPVLLAIGQQDRRVPPSQGKTYYHLLKAHSKAHVE